MKICSFCNTENKDAAIKCASCGGNSFKQKCDNCGTVFADGVHCPHCGVKVGEKAKTCPKCHKQYYSNACPDCGYTPNSLPAATVRGYTPTAKTQRKTWLWVLGWIFIFPLPLTLILIKKDNMSKGMKYGIIAAAWVIYAGLAFYSSATNNGKPQQENNEANVAVTATEAPTEKETEPPTEEPTEEPTEAETEEPTEEPTEAATPIVITNYPNTIDAGSTAMVTIQGAPDTEYSIHVVYDSGESDAEGLEPKTSDANGYVSWEWKVGINTAKGEHTIRVEGGGSSETVKFTVN